MSDELLNRKTLDKLLSDGATARTYVTPTFAPEDVALSLNADTDSIQFKGFTTQSQRSPEDVVFSADSSKAFVRFTMSSAFPNTTVYGQAIHPAVIAKSFKSLLFSQVDFEHVLVSYAPEVNTQDKILGSVVAVNFPDTPREGWRVNSDKSKAPAIQGVGVFSKLARHSDTIIGKHKSGRKNFAVSMETAYGYEDMAFAVALNNGKAHSGMHDTPDDMVSAGWEVVPILDADAELLGCFSVKKQRIVNRYKNREVVQLLGGTSGTVHYNGVAICAIPAEPTAKILQMAASSTADTVSNVIKPLRRLVELAKSR